jgi:hypothetical protein
MSTNIPRSSSTTARAAIGSLIAIGVLAPLAGGFLRAQPAPGVLAHPGSGITSAVVNGTSGVDHSKAMAALSRLFGTTIPADTKQTPYMKWMTEDVVYIITREEAAAFQNLATDEEREKFIEQFWLRRDPSPGTPANEFKQEHYRRIAMPCGALQMPAPCPYLAGKPRVDERTSSSARRRDRGSSWLAGLDVSSLRPQQ